MEQQQGTLINTPPAPEERLTSQKINKGTAALKDTLDQMDLTALHRTFHPKPAENKIDEFDKKIDEIKDYIDKINTF